MKDINDYMPKLPPNSWGARLNWVPKKVEIDDMLVNSPFSYNSKWHTIDRVKGLNSLVIDGKEVRQSDDSKLT